MIRDKNMRRCFSVLAILLCLAGCGVEEGSLGGEGREVLSAGTGNLYINDVLMLQFEEPDMEIREKTLFYDTYGSKLYILWTYVGEEDTAQSLYVFDGETKEMGQQSFFVKILDGEDICIWSMDVRDGERISFRMGGGEGDFLVITDMEGNIISRQEPFPDWQEYPWNGMTPHRHENRAFEVGDGTVILSRGEEAQQVTELFWYDADTGKETPLTVFDGELVRSLCMDGSGVMYYTTPESLNRWDMESNTRIRLLELHHNGLSSSPVSNNLLTNSQGEILICEPDKEAPCVYVLSGEKNQKESELRIAYFTAVGSDTLARSAKLFFQTYPEIELVQERCENESEGTGIRDRILIELAAGRGPEVMWVRDEDMHILQEKGLLMDLSELISEDIQDQILPGVIRAGTVNDRLAGIKLYAYYQTMFVSDTVWEGDSWTLEDIVGIMESREDWESTFTHEWRDLGPYELLSEVLLTDLDGSEFLDTKRGYCNFESPEFIRLLEICKKYGQVRQTSLSTEECRRQLEEGTSIACVRAPYGLVGFSKDMNIYSDSAHMVGFPTREGCKNYFLTDNTYLAVSAKAEHVEEIREYLAFVESCEPASGWQYTMAGRVLAEELQPYFAGDKSAEEVARIVQSRVQTYLNEMR